MKTNCLRLTLALLVAVGGAAQKTDMSGDWEGTLEAGSMKLRVVFHITQGPEGALKATLDSVDQSVLGIHVDKVTVNSSSVTLELNRIQGRYDAKLNAVGSELTGEWTQASQTFPLVLKRATGGDTVAKTPLRPTMSLTPEERNFLISYLESTRKEFVNSISQLSSEQWSFKPAPERWSIAECAEHIIASEDFLFRLATQEVIKPAPTGSAARTRSDDEQVINMITDRSKKAQAPEPMRPTGKFTTPPAAVDEINKRRDQTIQYVRTTQEDLRSHVLNNMDAYQYLVLLSGHSSRHTAQIQEVKKDPKYPN